MIDDADRLVSSRQASPSSKNLRDVAQEMNGAADIAAEAQAAAGSVRDEAAGVVDTIRHGLSDQFERQKSGIADRLGAVAERAQQTAGELRDQEAWLGDLLGRGAAELASTADEIRSNDVAGLLGSAEVFARRQPALVMGAAVVLGFALTRFAGGGLKVSDIRRDHLGRVDYSPPDLGRHDDGGGMAQARRPMMDPALGGSQI